jgi:hypothetical protein
MSGVGIREIVFSVSSPVVPTVWGVVSAVLLLVSSVTVVFS